MKLNNIDFNKVAVFCQVIESGNYQRASEVLHVTPSALSQTIAALEHALSFDLFDRLGKRLIPTAAGLRLHREFRQAQAGFMQALTQMQENQIQVVGTLRIGAYLEFAKSRLTFLIRDFIQEYPDANIKMTFGSPSRLQQLLNQGQLDLCLSIFRSAERKTIRSKTLCEEELVLISAPHLLPDLPTLEQVLKTPIIDYYYQHQPIGRWISLHFGKRPKKIPVRIFAATAEMVVSLVRSGAGIGIVPKYLVAPQYIGVSKHMGADSEAQGLKIIRPTGRRLTDYIWLLESAGSEKSAVHEAFKTKLMTMSFDD